MDYYKLTFDEDVDFYTQLEELNIYHKKMLEVITVIRDMDIEEIKKKISDCEIVIPTKPKSELCNILKFNSNQHIGKKETRNNSDIHSYLVKLLVPNIKIEDIKLPNAQSSSDIFTFLRKYDLTIKKHSAYSFYLNSAFGYYLDVYFNNYFKNKNIPWKKHIKQEFNISESHGRKLRTVGKLVDKYPTLKLLNISFTTFYKLHPKIEKMLEDPEYNEFWRK